MKILTLIFTIAVSYCSQAFAGNLSLIEKRLLELDKLNKEAVKELGDTPQNGTISFKAKVYPEGTKENSISGISERRFSFGSKKIVSVDELHPYTVQISSSQSQDQCFKVASMLRRAGYPAFTASLELKDKGVWHRIFVGSFATREQAEDIKTKLAEDEITDGFIRSLPYAVQVGTSGSNDDIKELRESVARQAYLPYSTPVRNQDTGEIEARLLVGAFKTKEDSANLIREFRDRGLTARVVKR